MLENTLCVIKKNKNGIQQSTYCRAGFGGTPTADSRIAVPCPSDRNALRNPPRQHVPTVVRNMKNIACILMCLLVGASCHEKNKVIEYEEASSYDIISSPYSFKVDMTSTDTLEVLFDHSICLYHCIENIVISKISDSLIIESSYIDFTFDEEPQWKNHYTIAIPESDTAWKFGEFLKSNNHRLQKKKSQNTTLSITNKNDTLYYSAQGLADLNTFISDYYSLMKQLYPENNQHIYGVPTIN